MNWHAVIHWGGWLPLLKIAFGFTLIIGIHEFGHALASWLCGVKVKKFSIGVGWGLKFKNVPMVNELVISPILVGGYVQLDDETLESKGVFKRLLVYSGGMIMNVITAAVCLALLGANFFIALANCAFIWIAGWPLFFWMLASSQISGQAASDSTMGPVGIAGMMASNKYFYLGALALINICVAMMNLFPLPPLDGGHIARVILEKIVGKKWAMKVHTALLFLAIPLFLSLFLFATYNDIKRLIHPS